MKERVIQKIAPIIHGYYQARGKGLEKACSDVFHSVYDEIKESDISQCANVSQMSESNLGTLTYLRNDRLLVSRAGIVEIYEAQTVYAYDTPTIKECKWRLIDEPFPSVPVSADELIAEGAFVYLLRSI